MKFKLLFIIAILAVVSCKDQKPETLSPSKTSNQAEVKVKSNQKSTKQQKVIENQIKEFESSKAAITVKSKPVKTKLNKTQNIEVQKKKPKVSKKKDAPKKVYLPKIEFEEMIFDFGEIVTGDKLHHKFVFKNTGNADLNIDVVDASCGCTQPSFPFIPIAPGESGYIGVDYNSVSKEGPQKPEIEVYTNVSPKPYVLYLKGFVLKEMKEEIELDSVAEQKEINKKDSTLRDPSKIIDSLKTQITKDTTSMKEKN